MKSKILAQKPEADILFPTAKEWHFCGQTYLIRPMPDSKISRVADKLQTVAGLFQSLAKLQAETGIPLTALSPADLAEFLPALARVLLPCQSAIIAIAIDKPEEWVAENVPLARKLQALRFIIEAEDLPLILQGFQALAGAFASRSDPTEGRSESLPATPETSG